MIKFEHFDGFSCPVFVCAQCGRPINGQDGIIQWDKWDRPTFIALHKGPDKPCTWQWEREHDRDEWTGWEDLDVFLTKLIHNTQHRFEEAARS